MTFPWALLIAFAVLAFAYFIKHFAMHVVEDGDAFLMIIGVFLVVYVIAAAVVGILDPLTSVIPAYLAGNG